MEAIFKGIFDNEATHCDNFTSIGKSTQTSLTGGGYLVVGIGDAAVTIKIPASMSGLVIVLGSNAPNIKTETSTDLTLDENGVAWN